MRNLFFVLLIIILYSGYIHSDEPYYLIETSDVSFLPNQIHSGDVVSLSLNVKDIGEVYFINDLNGVIDLGTQFSPVKNSDYIKQIAPKSKKTLVFSFKVNSDTIPGYYPIQLTLNYMRNSQLVTENQEIVVPITYSDTQIGVETLSKPLNPGELSNLVFRLNNYNSKDISNVKFEWKESGNQILSISGDNKRYVSIIPSNGSVDINYNIATDPNIIPGIYPMDVNVSFSDSEGTKTQSSTVGLLVGGDTNFDIAVERHPNNQYTFSVVNIGKNDADATVIIIPRQNEFTVNGTDSVVLGNIKKGDYTVANFEISSRSDTNQFRTSNISQRADTNMQRNNRNSITVEVHYTDTLGNRAIYRTEVGLNSAAKSSMSTTMPVTQSSGISWYYYLILLLGLGYGVYYIKKHYTISKK